MERLDNKVLKKLKPKPKEEAFHEILLKCFKNNTIAKDTPPYFKKEIEKAMDLLKNIKSKVFQNFYLIKIMKILKR